MSAADAAELLDAFKAAALSVTKLYRTSSQAQAQSHADGYQKCLDDLFAFLDRERLGLSPGAEGSRIRRWAADQRLEGRDGITQESEDETDNKPELASSPELPHAGGEAVSVPTPVNSDLSMNDSAPSAAALPEEVPSSPAVEGVDFVVPTQDTFTFQSSHSFPQDAYMNIANLDLSDTAAAATAHTVASRPTTTIPNTRSLRGRNGRACARTTQRSIGHVLPGHKRKLDLAELFDLNNLDMFTEGKRRRHT